VPVKQSDYGFRNHNTTDLDQATGIQIKPCFLWFSMVTCGLSN